jgi:hypothetical protein
MIFLIVVVAAIDSYINHKSGNQIGYYADIIIIHIWCATWYISSVLKKD